MTSRKSTNQKQIIITQSAGVVEYTDYIPAEG